MTIKKLEYTTAELHRVQAIEAINELSGTATKSYVRPKRILFIGDSLTNSGTNWAIPKGVGSFLSNGSLANLNPTSVWWISDWQLDGRCQTPASGGVLETDGNGNLRYNHNGEGFGEYVDVSSGGFFQIPSISEINSVYVKIVKSRQTGVAASDSVTFQTLCTVVTAGANIFAEMVKDELGFVAEVQNWGIPSDDVAGLTSRYHQMISYQTGSIDAIVLLIGTNDQPANNASAISLAERTYNLMLKLKEHCKNVFVGGLFPRGDVAQNIDDAMVLYSLVLKEKCDTSDGSFIYWDAYGTLSDPTSVIGGLKTGAFHTDNLHLMPFGAYLVKKSLVNTLNLNLNINKNIVQTRPTQVYNETTGLGYFNSNPLYLGNTGTQNGSPAVTGRVPTGCFVSRTGGTQTITFSDVTSENQNSLRIAVAGSTTGGDYHELRQPATLPVVTGGWAGRYIQLVLDMEIEEATNMNKLEFALISDPLSNGVYWNQTSRVFNGFNSNNKHRITFVSEPMLVKNASITSYSLRLRIGTQSGGTATVALYSAGIREYRE